jgi:hypothetical protein
MASFAKIGLNGKVIEVLSVNNEVLHDSNGIEQEAIGIDFLTKLTGYPLWVQTSYNTHGGVHNNNGTPLRKNHAGIGMTYDENRDAFINKKPFREAPVAMPELTQEQIDNKNYYAWNEQIKNWELKNNE